MDALGNEMLGDGVIDVVTPQGRITTVARTWNWLVHADAGDNGLVVERLLELNVVLKECGDALHELLGSGRHFEVALAGADGGDEEAVAICDFKRLGALDALDQDLDVAVGHFDALHDAADGADLVDVLGFGLVD